VHKKDFVSFTISVVTVPQFGGTAEPDLDVVVPHKESTAAHEVPLGLEIGGVEEMVLMLIGHPFPPLDGNEATQGHHPAWSLEVIEDGVVA
jgi:hypothetical protein